MLLADKETPVVVLLGAELPPPPVDMAVERPEGNAVGVDVERLPSLCCDRPPGNRLLVADDKSFWGSCETKRQESVAVSIYLHK